jgi:hypothetical protein
VTGGFNNQLTADKEMPRDDDGELFVFHFLENNKVRLQTSGGKWIRAAPSGVLTVVSCDELGDAETFEVKVAEAPPLRGEYQLCRLLGPSKAASLITAHRKSFVTSKDFRQLAAKGLFAVSYLF